MTTQPPEQFTIRGNFQADDQSDGSRSRERDCAGGRRGGDSRLERIANIDAAFDATAAVSSRGTYGDRFGWRTDAVAARAIAQAGRGNVRLGTPRTRRAWTRARRRFRRYGCVHDMLERATVAERSLSATVFTETFYYPSGNVIGVVRGTDPKLANEYVALQLTPGSRRRALHGQRRLIWNGADDNASMSVALLAIARAFVKQPAQALGAVHLSWRGRAWAARLAVSRGASGGAACRRSSPCSMAT